MKFSPFVVLAASFFSTVVVASTQSIGSISVDTVASSLDLSPAALIETLEATKTTNVDLSEIQDSLTNGERFQVRQQFAWDLRLDQRAEHICIVCIISLYIHLV